KQGTRLILDMTNANSLNNNPHREDLPREVPLRSAAVLNSYFEGDSIQCLICGRRYNSLSAHLSTHGLSAEQYKRRYRIPLKRGLTGRQIHEAMSAAVRRRIEEGEFDEHFKIIRSMAHEAGAAGQAKRKALMKEKSFGV